MRMSSRSSSGSRSAIVRSTAAAGTISHAARGLLRLFTNSASEAAPVAFSFTSSCTACGDLSKTTHWWPPLMSRRTMFAPIRPSPIIPSCIVTPLFVGPSRTLRRPSGSRPLEGRHEVAIASSDLVDGRLSGGLLVAPADDWLPEGGAADGEADEARDRGRRLQPFVHPPVVLTSTEDDAADVPPAAAARRRHHLLAVFAAIEPSDLPPVRLASGVRQLADRLHHQPRAELEIVRPSVTSEPFELRFLGRHQQLEHEKTTALSMQVIGQPFQSVRLALVERPIALGVVAHQHLAEGRAEGLDVRGEVLAVLEVELVLPALLGGACGGVAARPRITKDGRAELLVHQDRGLVLRHAGGEGGLESVVDDALGRGDLRRLVRGERIVPPEHLGLERAAMVERQDVQTPVVPACHQLFVLMLR